MLNTFSTLERLLNPVLKCPEEIGDRTEFLSVQGHFGRKLKSSESETIPAPQIQTLS